MSDERAVYTTDLSILKLIREKFGGTNPFYFAMDLFSLGNLLDQKKIDMIFIKSSDFTDEIQFFFKGSEIFYYIFDEICEIEKIVSSRISNKNDDEEKESEKLKEIEKSKKTSKSFAKLSGDSPIMDEIRQKIIKAARTDLPVLITGETGTGKTLVANAIHELSSRKNQEILEVNVNEISDGLFESALFGHEQGSFTGAEKVHKGFFESADSTTLFFDEIGELPKNLQTKLLRAIDKKEFFPVGASYSKKTNARLIFATNANIPKKIIKGEFRQDLYRRLKNLLIELPPLRNHKQDIPLLAKTYMEKHGNGKYLSENSLKFLQTYDWPENIGQLENCLNRAIVFCDNDEINPENLEF